MRFKKVEERPDLIRDEHTSAILNIDNHGLKAYKKRKMKEDINMLKNEIQSLKELVLMSLEKKG